MPLLFVYGSLKEGFPNFHVNRGRRLPGSYRTVQAHPFYLAEGVLPCLVHTPGRGHKVIGQVFEVSDADLAAMDKLERLGQPGGYDRVTIEVEANDDTLAGPLAAFAYVQHESRLAGASPHLGPIAEYTLEHAKSLRW
jgi:gamma-glutamylaminecyclotransferase